MAATSTGLRSGGGQEGVGLAGGHSVAGVVGK